MLRQRSHITQESKYHSNALGIDSLDNVAKKFQKFPATFISSLQKILDVKLGSKPSLLIQIFMDKHSENLAQFNWMCTLDNISNKFWVRVEINSQFQ